MEKLRDMRVPGVRAMDTEAHTFEFVANSGQVDRVGEVLDPDGCEYDNWLKNPMILWAHDDWGLPVGKGLELGVDETDGLVGVGMWASERSDFAALVEDLFDGGFLNGFSVRFLASEWKDYDQGSEEFAKGIWRRYTKWELLEISVVDIPCDPLALRKAWDGRRESELRTMIRKSIDLRPDRRSSEPDLFETRRTPRSRAVTAPGAKGAVAYKKFPLADEDMSWSFSADDGNALIEKGGWELFGQCHSWKDPDVDPETKQAYKLPKQKLIDGTVKTVWRGVAAAMARLLGAADIPEDDRKAVYNLLAKYYAEFDKPVPEFKRYGPRDAVVAAFGIKDIGELLTILEPYIRRGVELDLETDGLLEVLEGRYDDAGEGKSEPDAAGDHIFGPDVDKALLETLDVLERYFVGGGENPEPDDEND